MSSQRGGDVGVFGGDLRWDTLCCTHTRHPGLTSLPVPAVSIDLSSYSHSLGFTLVSNSCLNDFTVFIALF